jgi:hypothetical protein
LNELVSPVSQLAKRKPAAMPFDPSTLLDVSHLATFLGGVAAGAAGKYMADLFTDQRHAREAKVAEDAQFERISKLMPDLMAEFRSENRQLVLREFVILPYKGTTFNHDKPRIDIHEHKHSAAKNQVGILVSEGYVQVVRDSDSPIAPPIYRVTERLVERLERAA